MADQWPHTTAGQQPASWQPHPAPAQPTYTRVPVETNHTFHLILSLVTCGAWLPVWVVMILLNSNKKRTHIAYGQGSQQNVVVHQPQLTVQAPQSQPAQLPPPPQGFV